MIPRLPQPEDALRGRAPAVFATAFDCRDGEPFPQPGECRANVFDCEDGLRFIASVDRHGGEMGTLLHVSASFGRGCPFYFAAKRGGANWAVAEMIRRAADILGVDPGRFDGPRFPTAKMVPHWFAAWPATEGESTWSAAR